MGTYLKFRIDTKIKNELFDVFEKHKNINLNQFKNDLGEENSFEDIFLINNDNCEIKVGIIDREFFSRDFLKDIYFVLIENCEIEEETINLRNYYNINNVPNIRYLFKTFGEYANIYCYESTKLGADWYNDIKTLLKRFVDHNNLFFDTLFNK